MQRVQRVQRVQQVLSGATGWNRYCSAAAYGRSPAAGSRRYQLAMRLHEWVLEFSARPKVARNRKYCEQITDASSGICRNVAEGFGRWTRRDFHNFLRAARASHVETEMLLDDAVLRGYLTPSERREIGRLLGRCGKAIAALMRSLREGDDDSIEGSRR